MNALESLQPLSIESNEENIDHFENETGLKLGSQHKKILVSYNVAKPKFTFYKKNKLEFDIDYFFGFSKNKYEDLLHNYNTYASRMPNELYPVASVNGSDLLCVNIHNGKTYYWFHEEDDWGLEGNKKWPTEVATSLNEFIESLSISDTPTQQEIERAKKQAKITKTTPIALKFKNEARAKKGLPPLTMEDFQ